MIKINVTFQELNGLMKRKCIKYLTTACHKNHSCCMPKGIITVIQEDKEQKIK